MLQDGSFSQPETAAEKRELLRRSFPLLADQDALLPPFRASTAGCTTVKLIALPPLRDDSDRTRKWAGERDNPADGPSDSGGGGEIRRTEVVVTRHQGLDAEETGRFCAGADGV